MSFFIHQITVYHFKDEENVEIIHFNKKENTNVYFRYNQKINVINKRY